MKRIYQYLMLTVLSGFLCLSLAVPANAQRGGGHSGGGGGRSGGGGFSRGGGGGGRSSSFSSPRQSYSGGISRGQNSNSYSSPRQSYSGGISRGQSSNSYSSPRQSYSGGISRGQSSNSFSSPQGSQRSNSFQGNTRSFSRGGSVGGGNNLTFRRGGAGSNFSGGYSRGGRYYPGGYASRSYSGRSSGYGYSPWSNRGGYFYNRGFYSSSYYPRLGFSLGVLPYGYYPFFWGDSQFYYSGGYFYQHDNDQYTVVEPPIGAAVNTLPGNAQAITINGQQYYEANGVYYTPITKDDGSVAYQVAGKDGQLDTSSNQDNGYAPQNDGYVGRQNNNNGGNQQSVAMPEIGDLFYSLPSDSRKIKINGQTYFVSPDDFYYQETQDQDGKKAYKVMGTPDDNPGN